jgi:hypothetical protein
MQVERGAMEKLKQYFDLLPQCILNYQFIEEGLRFCLFRQHLIVAIKVKDILPYKPPVDSIKGAAMGKLITYFREFCDDEALLKRLKEVKKKRDHIAHQGYLLTYEQQSDPQYISGQLDELEFAYREAKDCFLALQRQMKRFDDLAKSAARTKSRMDEGTNEQAEKQRHS